jgi:hypothetical protein
VPVTAAGLSYIERSTSREAYRAAVPPTRRNRHKCSARRGLLLCDPAHARRVAIKGQMSRAFRTGAAMDVDLLCHKRVAAFGAHHDRIEILAAETAC